jgi:hypothetical protein
VSYKKQQLSALREHLSSLLVFMLLVFFVVSVLLIYLGFLYCVFALFVFVLCHVPKCCLFGSPPVLNTEVHFVHFVLLCVFTFLVPCCDVSYNVRIKTVFGWSLPLVVCRKLHVLFALFVFAFV